MDASVSPHDLTPSRPAPRGPLDAHNRAERGILGCLLVAPAWWQQAQQQVGPDDFLDDRNHKLAEVIWDFQRNEGEPVFAEFLPVLKDLKLDDLAMELVQRQDESGDVQVVLSAAIEYLVYARERVQAARISADLRKTVESGDDESAVDLLRKLTESARRPDLRKGY